MQNFRGQNLQKKPIGHVSKLTVTVAELQKYSREATS
jgi:hypothetical protein